MYIYESHLGGLFYSEHPLSDDRLYCETCGDYDHELGNAETRAKAWEMLEYLADINGSGGYDNDYLEEFLNECFAGEDTE